METVKGLRDLLIKLGELPKNLERHIDGVLEENARQIERSAKRFAPYDLGKLRQSIIAAKAGKLSWRVYVGEEYGAYMEFGTGGLVQVPDELREVALRFKGKGVKRINIRPRPYLYPAFELQRNELLKDLEQLLEQETLRI